MAQRAPNALQIAADPELFSWNRDPIHQFTEMRTGDIPEISYEMLFEDDNKNSFSDLQMPSVKASLDPDLISKLFSMEEFGNDVTLSNLPDEQIKTDLKKELNAGASVKREANGNKKDRDASHRLKKVASDYFTALPIVEKGDLVARSPKLATWLAAMTLSGSWDT